jgi:hypothetical protein
MSPSTSRVSDFFVKVGTISAMLVCAGLFVKIFFIEAEPRELVCAQFGTGATGQAKRLGDRRGEWIVAYELNRPGGYWEGATIVLLSKDFSCHGVFGSGWNDAPVVENRD